MTEHQDTPDPDPDQDAAADGVEVGDQAVAPPLPTWRRRQPLGWWWILPVGLVAAFGVLLQGELREFGYVVAGTLAAAGLVRLVLPRGAVGGLLVRSRWLDVACLWGFALAVAFLSATLRIR